MLFNLCPACRSTNRPTARRCETCGAALSDFDTLPSALTRSGTPSDTVPASLTHRGAVGDGVDSQVGALWFDDLISPAAPRRPAPQPSPAGATELSGVVVREIRLGQTRVPADRRNPAPLQAPAATGAAPSAPLPPVTPTSRLPSSSATLPTDPAARAAIKVARRAAVRRARQAAIPPLQTVCDVLVMDTENVARNQLDDLLGDFGFRVRPVATLAQAALLAGFHPFAAVFVAVPAGAIDGAVHDLFKCAREVCRRTGTAPAVRVLMAAQWSPVDRVRAELAGCEATLARPASRRDIARVLDANGVVLPRDPRRA
ncbi:MAG: hypothetical protein Q7U73_07390 [Rubrivivax sp.]|nr:hypothetical protein [Rubrivivax sp.]